MALEAFDLELAQVPARVSEPMLGSIRFQCWREALADLAAGNVSRHKVVLALDRAGRASTPVSSSRPSTPATTTSAGGSWRRSTIWSLWHAAGGTA